MPLKEGGSVAEMSDDARFRLLVEAVTDYAIYMLDPAGVVSSWSPGAERAKGYIAEEIIGKNFSQFYTEPDRRAGLPQKALDTAAREGRFENVASRATPRTKSSASISPASIRQRIARPASRFTRSKLPPAKAVTKGRRGGSARTANASAPT